MEFNFDKEIDALLRQTAKGEFVSVAEDSKTNHLDADEISAFAENALPEKAKQRYTIHLADCDACRRKLSNVILLNADAQNETVPAKELKTISPAIPWYKRLFAYPNLAYTLGALVIIFSGIIGFTVLQNVNNVRNAEVSQINEKPQTTREMPADSAAMPETESSASSANMTANTNSAAALSSNAAVTNKSVSTAANSNTNAAEPKPVPAPPAPVNEPTVEQRSLAAKSNENSFALDGAENAAGAAPKEKADDKEAKDKKESEVKKNEDETADTTVSARQVSNLPKGTVFDSQLKTAKKSASSSDETTTVGKKTFRRANNVWYDADYNNQPTTNITRGTEEYKKLDKKLRKIAETLQGTFIVVWKERAYRIR